MERDRASKERSRSKHKRPQTAHYPVKSEFDSRFSPKQKPKRKRPANKSKSDRQEEYINIIKEYEDVLSRKAREKSAKKKKTKKEPYTLTSKQAVVTKTSQDPYEKYISFYPSRQREGIEMFDEKFAKE